MQFLGPRWNEVVMAMVMVAMMMMAMITIATAKHQLVVDGQLRFIKIKHLKPAAHLSLTSKNYKFMTLRFLSFFQNWF